MLSESFRDPEYWQVLRACLKRLARGNAVKHETDRGNVNQRFGGLNPIFVVLTESAITTEPSETAFHNPCQARDLEGALSPFGDVQLPTIRAHDLASQFTAFMPSICDDSLNIGKQWAQAGQEQGACPSIRYIRWLDSACDRQAQHIYQNVALTPFYAFVRIEAANAAAFCCLY